MLAGIDLGTTFSAVAAIDGKAGLPKIIPNREGSNITPSVIQFTDEGPVFGSEAKDAFDAGETNCVSTFKRSMGEDKPYCSINGKDYTAEDLSALLLKRLKEDAEAAAGESIEEAVITVPAYFYSKEREATISAARRAGLKVRKIINEPTAAAIAYGLNHWRTNARILVYDLGGGTFDVTLVEMKNESELNTISTEGDHYLGGQDWDKRLGTFLVQRIREETGEDPGKNQNTLIQITRLAENCKKQLSQKQEAKVPVSLPNFGHYIIEVKREEFNSLTADLLDKTGVLCEAVLRQAGVRWTDITDILLVGGSTRMPQVPEYLFKLSGKKPISHVNPDEAVALGAAVQTTLKDPVYTTLDKPDLEKAKGRSGLNLSAPAGQEKKISNLMGIRVSDVTPHALGIIAVSEKGDAYINETIIPANYPIPVKSARAFRFYTGSSGDNELEVYVLQGDKRPLECKIPCKYVVSGIRRGKGGKTTLRIQYSYNGNGVINVQARQEDDAVDLPIRKEPVPDDMSKYGLPPEQKEFMAEKTSVFLALDVSGSMSGKPLISAKDAMCSFVEQMDMSVTRIGIIAVSDQSRVVLSLCSDARRCCKAIRDIECGETGFGNSADPFDDILKELGHEEGRRFAIVLADGVWSHQTRAVRAAKACHKAEIETAAIGFGDADKQFLRDISSSDANALKVSQSELSKTFGKIAQTMGSSNSGKFGKKTDEINAETWETPEL
ncbi:MAG: Hsp70 family protein [Treponema sp.]|jgi:molecular chaperone DnaK|nr:Hsp70 family protein [Treponema sp.]